MARIQSTNAKRGAARPTGQGARLIPSKIGAVRTPFEAFTGDHKKLAYDTTRWQAYLYAARQTATKAEEKELVDPIRTDDRYATAKDRKVTELSEAIGRELFGRMYGDPALKEDRDRDVPVWIDRVHQTLDGMPEWEQLRKQVHGDPDFSALATKSMLKSLAPRLADLIKEVKAQVEGTRDGSPDQLVSAADALRADLRSACQNASQTAADGKDALGSIAAGLDGTPPAEFQKETERFDLLQAVMQDPDFAEIARRAGRIKRVSGRAEMRKSKNVREEIVDIELGADIERLLPSELANLVDEDLELLALSRLAERKAMQYRLEGHEPMGRGPIIFCRDVSGSMCGSGHLWGAAVAVALTSQAWKEKRPLISCNFNHDVHAMRKLDPVTGLSLLNRRAEEIEVVSSGRMAPAIAAVEHSRDGVSGGTTFSAPLRFAMAAGLTEPRADFVFLTDGCAEADPATLEKLVAAKGSGLRVFGMTVNGGSVSGALQEICDEILDIDSVPQDDDGSTLAKKLGGVLRGARA